MDPAVSIPEARPGKAHSCAVANQVTASLCNQGFALHKLQYSEDLQLYSTIALSRNFAGQDRYRLLASRLVPFFSQSAGSVRYSYSLGQEVCGVYPFSCWTAGAAQVCVPFAERVLTALNFDSTSTAAVHRRHS